MRPRLPPTLWAVVVVSTLTTWSGLAAERSCPAVGVEVDAGVRAVFPDAVERIHAEFSARPDVDTCARVALSLREDDDIEVSVALPDGRTSSRTVTDAEDVIPTLQALLLIPVPASAAQSEPPETPLLVAVPPRAAARVDTSDSKRGVWTAGERTLGVELSALIGARAGDGQIAYGAGALSLVEVSRWLFGFEGRVDAYQSASGGGDPESALLLALLVGRRFYFDSVALDLTAGPAVATKGLALTQTEPADVNHSRNSRPQPPPPEPEPSTGPLPRLLVGARLGVAPRSVLRAFVGFEGELGPSQGTDDPSEVQRTQPSSSRLPAYSVALVVGATVGTP